MLLAGKKVVVVGGSSGIGLATAEMAKREGVGRVVYLGGLGDKPRSKHLRSRAQTAEILGEHGPSLT